MKNLRVIGTFFLNMFFYINFLLHRARGMTLRWSRTYKKVQVEKFSASSGPKVILPSTILEVFLCFFTEELLRMITDQSNLYAWFLPFDGSYSTSLHLRLLVNQPNLPLLSNSRPHYTRSIF